ncbi:MAG: AMP-binding protein, partial [Cyanobacteria bacterium]|nr:AMP-binding protein [Cyanobacteriota bacterium]
MFEKKKRAEFLVNDNNVCSILDRWAVETPYFTSLVSGVGRSCEKISYEDLSTAVAQRAGRLAEYGIGIGSRVLVLTPMSIDLYITLMSLFRLGAAAIISDDPSILASLHHAIDQLAPDALIAGGPGVLLSMRERRLRNLPLKFSSGMIPPGWKSLNSVTGFKAPAAKLGPDAPALITFTSGTSGKPKIIVRSHQFLLNQLEAIRKCTGMLPGSCELTALPVFVLANMASCVTSILPMKSSNNSLRSRRVVLQLLHHRPDRILASPSLIDKINAYCQSNRIKLPFVRHILTGGGPVFPRLIKHAMEICANAEVSIVYGSSEAEPVARINSKELTDETLRLIQEGAGLPVGSPVSGTAVKILPLQPASDPIQANKRFSAFQHICDTAGISVDAIGEIVVTGPQVVKRYFDGLGDTKILMDGKIWHRTGDVGYFDQSGKLW